MTQRKFDAKIAEWDDEKLNAFLDYRLWLLTEAPGNICTPATDRHVVDHAPFMTSHYPHAVAMGDILGPDWCKVLDSDPRDLIDPNPFTDSRFREGGKQVWDAAVGIPACEHRISEIVSMSRTPALRNCNRYWQDVALPALSFVGPLGSGQEILRPTAPYMIDFTELDEGWMYLEAAHVLAHMRGDTKRMSKNPGIVPSSTLGKFQSAVAEIAVALIYDMPLYIGLHDEGRPATPDFEDMGLEVKSSSSFGLPMLRAPWANREALRFDETLGVVSVAVFMEPHPYGYTTGTLKHSAHDKWCCMPTIAMVTGWETSDIITHQPLVSGKPENPDYPICYGTHPMDLMPPDLLWAYLALGMRKRKRALRVDATHMYVNDWIMSPQFEEEWFRTPSFPCKGCMGWNHKTEGRPRKPPGFLPPRHKVKSGSPEALYYKEVDLVHGIVENAVKDFEALYYSNRAVRNRVRAARKRGWNAKMRTLKEAGWLDDALRKIREGKTLTSYQETVYFAYLDRIRKKNERSA
jgi:hypothetical protein